MANKKQCAGTVDGAKNPNRGKPCRRWAVTGSEFCAVHGGSLNLGSARPDDLKNRCVATAKGTNDRCKRAAIPGGTVCKMHGGAAKNVQKKARELLDRAVEPALHQLRDIMLKPGTSDSDRLRAIQMVLDRTGNGPGSFVEHTVTPWENTLQVLFKGALESGQVLPTIQREPSPETLASLGIMPEALTFGQPSYQDMIDAELVEDEPEPDVIHLTSERAARREAQHPRSQSPRAFVEPPHRNR